MGKPIFDYDDGDFIYLLGMPLLTHLLFFMPFTKRSIAIEKYLMLISKGAGGRHLFFSICRRIILTKVALYSPLGIFVKRFNAALFLRISRHLSGSIFFVYEILEGIRAV